MTRPLFRRSPLSGCHTGRETSLDYLAENIAQRGCR